MSMYSMSKMGLLNNGKESELSLDRKNVRKFLDTVADDYNNEIPYHNQMHAADVMHMSYLMMTQFGLINILHMKDVDKLSVVIAAACHDLGHDGFTNSYHVNAVTLRAIYSND